MNAALAAAALILAFSSAQAGSILPPEVLQSSPQTLFIEHGGALILNGKTLGAAGLRQFATNHQIYVRAGMNTSYSDFIAALARIQAVPGTGISLVMQDRTGK